MLARGRAAASVMLGVSIAAWQSMGPIATAQSASSSSTVTIQLQRDDAALRERVAVAARESVALFSEWLGPLPGAMTVTDDPQARAQDTVRIHPAWPAAPPSMDVESEVAFELARRWWPENAGAAIVNGAAWYLQSRAVARVFDLVYERDGHSAEVVRLFGGYYPLAFPSLRFDGPAAGLGRARLSQARAQDDVRLPAAVTTSVVRVAHAFASLERLVGRPRVAGALSTTRAASSDAGMIRGLGAALGQDVEWLFGPALDPGANWDYAIRSVDTSSCEPQPCHGIRVEVSRLGNAVFSGRSHSPDGTFLSGDAIGVRVEFADGQAAVARWDGRDEQRVFEFQGAAAPVRVQLDPDGVLLVDGNWLDHSRVMGGVTNAPVEKWVARWLVWLQTAMLAYSGIV